MTANEDASPIDLDAINENLPAHYFDCDRFRTYGYGAHQGDCDCTATTDMTALIAELRSHASIGPDSERIRELDEIEREVDCGKHGKHSGDVIVGLIYELRSVHAALRADGLLPGPGDIVVSRDALQLMWRYTCDHVARNPALGMPVLPPDVHAALSQPHPESEGAS